jgi:glutathione synthase/RimK-type ligase-like ATP-grasp enzyme
MKKYRILPYKQGSRSARALADALNGRVLKLEGTRYRRQFRDHIVVNWGNNNPRTDLTMLNARVEHATNKLSFFQRLEGQDLTPAFWVRQEDIPDEAFPVVCRTVLNGHSGAGIVMADSREQLVPAPLYVKYVKKLEEYRIHVGREIRGPVEEDGFQPIRFTIISEQRKVRDRDREVTDWRIRNHGNGFVFQRNGIQVPDAVRDSAVRCIERLDIDFGAVDVIWNERSQRAYVLEVNTAPGLEGQTIQDYAQFFRSL